MTPTQQQWDEALDELNYQINRYEALTAEITNGIAEYKATYPQDFEVEIEQADNQRELVFSFNQSMEAKESA